jgi:sugar transferase (PEP-CTERM/EpsH1 system associated)
VRILYLCHRFPYPPEFGSKVRAFHTIKHLAERHEVTVAAPVRSAEEAEAAKGIAPYCHQYMTETISSAGAVMRMVLGAPTRHAASVMYFYAPALARRVRAALRHTQFDLIFVHCASVAPYVEDVTDVPMILDFVDMDSQKWMEYSRFHGFPKSLVYRVEATKMKRAEIELAGKFDMCTCATEAERQVLLGFGVDTPTAWFPNGVDLDFFAPTGDAFDPNAIVFIGRMDYYPNRQAVRYFCNAVLPRIQEVSPKATFSIVGAMPTEDVLELAKLTGVTVTGTVPDVRPHVRKAAASVAPLRIARGTQNKILESLAMGVPVVSSTEAAKGVDAIPGEHFLVADEPQDFADRVLRLMNDPGERARFAKAGRARMESHYTWRAAMRKLDTIIDDCLARRGLREPDVPRNPMSLATNLLDRP